MVESRQIVREWLTAAASSGIGGALASDVTATGLTWTLSSGGSSFSDGLVAVKCGSELAHATRSGNVLTVDEGGRGAFGTTAAAHLAGATVSEATLYDVVGSRVRSMPPADNALASVWMEVENDEPVDAAPVLDVQFLMRCFGGSNDPRDARAVYRLLDARLHRVFEQATTSGRISSAYRTGGGELLRDPDTEWLFAVARFSVVVAT